MIKASKTHQTWLRSEKDIKLRIDLLEGQSSTIAKMLAKAIQEHNEEAIKLYSEKLALRKSRVEELLWVLGIQTGQGVLDSRVSVNGVYATVAQILEKLKTGEIKMEELALDVQTLVRKGALELQNATKHMP